MLTETIAIVRNALRLDGTLTESERRDALARFQQKTVYARKRIQVSEARKLLGISQATWSRRCCDDLRYRKIKLIRDGIRVFAYLDEIEAIRDGEDIK